MGSLLCLVVLGGGLGWAQADKAMAQEPDSSIRTIVQGVRDDVQRRIKENERLTGSRAEVPRGARKPSIRHRAGRHPEE